MLFVNNTGGKVKLRLGEHKSHYWKTLREGEEIDLLEAVGNKLNLSVVEVKKDPKIEEKPKKQKSTPKRKPEPNKDYEENLRNINGIGPKTVQDIMKVYKTPKELIRAIDRGEKLPFRDDVVIKLKKNLKKAYGGRHG